MVIIKLRCGSLLPHIPPFPGLGNPSLLKESRFSGSKVRETVVFSEEITGKNKVNLIGA